MTSQRDTSDRKPADRTGGGPGSSHQGGSHGHATSGGQAPDPGAPTSTPKSRVSGGGGERDSHHTHDAGMKGDRSGR